MMLAAGSRVSYCGRVRGRLVSPQTVHLAHCHTAAHAPTRDPPTSLVLPSTNHRPTVLTVTGIMERQRHAWSGMAKRGVRVGGVGGEKLQQGGSNLPAKYGRGLTGVKIEKLGDGRRELGETLEE